MNKKETKSNKCNEMSFFGSEWCPVLNANHECGGNDIKPHCTCHLGILQTSDPFPSILCSKNCSNSNFLDACHAWTRHFDALQVSNQDISSNRQGHCLHRRDQVRKISRKCVSQRELFVPCPKITSIYVFPSTSYYDNDSLYKSKNLFEEMQFIQK